ncbi:MAG: ABC transporter permease, partial [Bdellovibrionaceae bacterium]|nr:ABC transporter permease [Pseudobdellovibrionaceae bacterium]
GQQVGKMFGTNTYPVTYAVLDLVGGSFDLFILIIITFFAGEVVWRDRDNKLQQVIDSYPVPNTALIFAKLLNLFLLVMSLLAMIIVSGVAIQLIKGYTHFELGLYLRHLYGLRLYSFINIVVLAVFFQALLNNKFLAHGAMILYYIIYAWSNSMGFEHKLYMFNAAPSFDYSDMNGYGHFLPGFYLFKTYWLSLSVLMIVAMVVFWQRGNLTAWKDRLREAKRRFKAPLKITAATALSSFIGFGSFLFYNTNIKTPYITDKFLDEQLINYEKKYSQYKHMAQLQAVAIKAFVDIFPKDIAVNLKYVHQLKNKTTEPITKLLVTLPSRYQTEVSFNVELSAPTKIEFDDRDLGLRMYVFEKPIPAGEVIEMTYIAHVKRQGIPNRRDIRNIVYNGTFFNNNDYSIASGYNKDAEVSSSKTREKYGLPPKKRMAEIGDAKERIFTYISNHSTWIDFEATVSTDKDQIGIAPGYLQKEWEENGRKYFHYKMDQKILNFFAFLSGKYTVAKDKWNDVNIEVYYHEPHTYNIQKMIEASKLSLDYFTKNFGPYQHKQYRILEFPRYETFAQAFPNTIPFSEAVGFIAHVEPNNPKDVDYPFYITAHELAHQWWAHQVIGGNVQGATMLSESFSQYSALMVMQKKYGREKMQRFLRYELERYLGGRAQEDEYEQPLYLNENQTYIHYQKGSLVLFALKEYIGEDKLNLALKTFLEKKKFQESPFTVSTEFLETLKAIAPKDSHPLIEDMFEKIVIFENKPLTATYKILENGQYEVKITASAQKWYSDKDGKETLTDFSQEFDIGITDNKGDYLYLKKHPFKSGENSFTVIVSKQPAKAGVDPLNYIIDRTPDDNLMPVSTL